MPVGAGFGLIVGALVVLAAVMAARRGEDGLERIVRCRSGHLFTSTYVPGASIKAVRLWNRRLQWCPVGRHWTLVRTVPAATLTAEERAAARSVHDSRIP